MTESQVACVLCRGHEADVELGVTEVWEDDLWRLTVANEGDIVGFSHLEPKRHIPHITDLDGEEARTFGSVLARTTSALREATHSEVGTSTCSVTGSLTCISISLRIDEEMRLTLS